MKTNLQFTFFIKKTHILLTISLFYLSGIKTFAQTFYIDPSTESTINDGTIENPFLSWDDITLQGLWQDSATYLQKRGTVCEAEKVVNITASYVTLGAYGTGEKPVIKSLVGVKAKGIQISGSCTSVSIKNLEIYSTNDIVCAIIIGGIGPHIIDSCILHDCSWGIRVFNTTGKLTVSNSEIYDIGDDGIYTQNTEDIEIYGCNIHDVNADLPIRETAGGDCIQITGEQGYLYIHDNILDHSAFGRKFCLIIGSGDVDNDQPHEALVENNIMIGYKDTAEITSGLYLKESISHLTFRNNIVKDAATGIWLDASTTAHNNIFLRCDEGINLTSGDTAFIANNTFVDNEKGIKTNYSSVADVYNNIFYKGDNTLYHFYLFGNITLDYNCFNMDGTGLYSGYNSLTEWQTNKGKDLNSFVGDPKFVDFTNEDFHITESSPCIDVAMLIDGITEDMDGTPIPTGNGPDIGADEFSSTNYSATSLASESINTINLYPNPTTGIVNISLHLGVNTANLSIYNLAGEVVYNNSNFCGEPVDLSGLQTGVYFVKLNSGNTNSIAKLIKK